MRACGFIDVNKHTALVWDVERKAMYVGAGGAELHGDSLYFPLNFAANLKLL